MVREIIKDRSSILNEALNKYKNSKGFQLNYIAFFSEAENRLDSRLIKYSVTENKTRRIENILVSNPDFLIPLLDDNSRILILMGCEAADKFGRVMRTYNYKDKIVDFLFQAKRKMVKLNDSIESNKNLVLNKKYLQEYDMDFYSKCRVVVFCESYKLYDNLAQIQSCFQDQYGETEIFESELISAIITEKDT